MPRSRHVFQTAKSTGKRFPLVILTSLIGGTAGLFVDEATAPSGSGVAFLCALGFLATSVIAELRLWKGAKAYALHFSMACVLALFGATSQSLSPALGLWSLLLLAASLVGLLASAPVFSSNRSIDDFWDYNKVLFLRFLSTAFFTLPVYLGMHGRWRALNYLFELTWHPGSSFLLLNLILGLFSTPVFLAGIPKVEALPHAESRLGRTDEEGIQYPVSLRAFMKFVFIPLTMCYLIILYAYCAAILARGTWPQGEVAHLIIGFNFLGLLGWLLCHPLPRRVTQAGRLVPLFQRAYFWAQLPLLGFLLVAVWLRVRRYGFTEERYILLAAAIWLTGISLLFTVARWKDLRIIPLSLCATCFLAGWGPWGFSEVSRRSQLQRLSDLLQEAGIELSEAPSNSPAQQMPAHQVPARLYDEIQSTALYLNVHHGFRSFAQGEPSSGTLGMAARSLLEVYNIQREPGATEKMRFSLFGSRTKAIPTHGFTDLGWIAGDVGKPVVDEMEIGGQRVSARIGMNGDTLILDVKDVEVLPVPIKDRLLALHARATHNDDVRQAAWEDLSFDVLGQSGRYRIVLSSVFGYAFEGAISLESFEGYLLVRSK